MGDYQPKPFVCSHCGLVLGESYRKEKRHVTHLRIYRYPRALSAGLDERDVPTAYKFAAVKVTDCAVPCFCGNETEWSANQDAIEDLIKRKQVRRLEVEHGRFV